MERKEEIKILIEHLKKEVILATTSYPLTLTDTIIKNGKKIEQYMDELKTLS